MCKNYGCANPTSKIQIDSKASHHLPIKQAILAKNHRLADHLRETFQHQGIPGAA